MRIEARNYTICGKDHCKMQRLKFARDDDCDFDM